MKIMGKWILMIVSIFAALNCYSASIEEIMIAAQKGDAEAMWNYGDALRFGEGCEKNVKEGYEWIEKAAEAGYPDAMAIIGWVYVYGNPDWPIDYDKGFYWVEKSMETGDPESTADLGKLYYYGLGCRQNYDKAFEYLMKSGTDYPSTNYLLAQSYYYGRGVKANKDEGLKYWNTLINQSQYLPEARFYVGLSYFKGSIVSRDYTKAVDYLTKAASQNVWQAKALLSECYRLGLGVAKNEKLAKSLLEEAKSEGYNGLLMSKMLD